MKTVKRSLLFLLIAFVLNTVVYFGFITNYTKWLYSQSSYELQYNHSVYKYRLLGKYSVLKVYHILKQKYPEKEIPTDSSLQTFLGPQTSENFYNAYYIVNTFFLLICAVLLAIIFESRLIGATEKEKYMIPFILISIICLTQFVIVPYDILAYVFILLSLLFVLKFFENKKLIWFVCTAMVVFIATFNRETAALSISLVASICWMRYGFGKNFFIITGTLLACMLLPYIGLRFYLRGTDQSVVYNFFKYNITHWKGLLGILFWFVMGWFSIVIADTPTNRRAIFLFHLFCLPYIITCLISGLMFEMRLYVPIFITSLIIGKFSQTIFTREKNNHPESPLL